MKNKILLTMAVACLSLAAPAFALSEAQLNPLCAPYALYPDALLAEVLTASTLPDQLMAAFLWTQANPTVQGDALNTALASQTWDPSVKALCTFPDVLKKMTDDMTNTRSLGQAFSTDQADVMECVQDLRAKAQSLGALQTTPQQTVVTSGSTIQIQPTNPQTIYVPTYDPGFYGGSYPYGAGLLTFGAGVALGSVFDNNYGAFDWNNHAIYTGAGVRDAYYHGGAYTGLNAWGGGAAHVGTTDVYHGPMGGTGVYHSGATAGVDGFHTGTTAAYRGPAGGVDTFHSSTNAYRGYGGFSEASHTTAFSSGFAGGGFDDRAAARGWGSMGGGYAHFGGGFRR